MKNSHLPADMESRMKAILEEVLAKNRRQYAKWGKQNHDPVTALREEWLQVAAVAVAAIEALDREEWSWDGRDLRREQQRGFFTAEDYDKG